jgi:deoxycytidylate deaminase
MYSKNIRVKINKCIEITKCLKKNKESGRSFHTTFIYDKGKLLSIGFNSYKKLHRRHIFGAYKGTKDNPEQYIAGIHSEIDAIIKLGRTDCSRLTFINIRIDNNEHANISKPCENCFRVLQGLGFKQIYYIDASGFIQILKWNPN